MASSIPSQVIAMLGAVPLFSACSKQELRTIASLGTEIEAKAGRKLAVQGKPGLEFFLILEGHARAEVDGVPALDFGPGDFFGEMALIDHGPRHATVTALTPMRLLVLDAREFNSLLETSPSIVKKLLFAFASRQRKFAGLTH